MAAEEIVSYGIHKSAVKPLISLIIVSLSALTAVLIILSRDR